MNLPLQIQSLIDKALKDVPNLSKEDKIKMEYVLSASLYVHHQRNGQESPIPMPKNFEVVSTMVEVFTPRAFLSGIYEIQDFDSLFMATMLQILEGARMMDIITAITIRTLPRLRPRTSSERKEKKC